MKDISVKVEQYITMRNAVSAKKKEFDNFKAEMEQQMKDIELEILEVSNSSGVDSFKTSSGTAFKTTKTFARTANREATIEFAKKTGDFGLFTSHVNKTHVKELIEDGLDPSVFGVDYFTEVAINIRKS